jgi:hypothetical protein
VLNIDKCEVIIRQLASSAATVLSHFSKIDISYSCLLGTPLHADQALAAALENKLAELQKAVDSIRLVPAHDVLVFLRWYFSAPRLMHILRCSSCHGHPALTAFDALLRKGVSLITKSKLSDIQ